MTQGGRFRAGSAPAGKNPLQQLIADRRRERGLSYADIADAGGLSRSTVYYLARTDPLLRSPSATTMEGLARGLDVSVDAVRQAVAAAVGLHVATAAVGGDPGLGVLMASVEKLTPEQRQHVAALVHSLLGEGSATGR